MEKEKLSQWAKLLLDTGKRNNLINFKDKKLGTVEIIVPDFEILFSKVENNYSFEVFDPKIKSLDEEYDDIYFEYSLYENPVADIRVFTKSDYLMLYSKKIKKQNQILLFNEKSDAMESLKSIDKQSKMAIEEAGVNVAYMAFGFINWHERDDLKNIFQAPILLVPIKFKNESSIDPYYITVTEDDIIVNPTFDFKLQNEYGFKLPEYQDQGINNYLDEIEKMISKLNWTITRECKVGLFSFLKINMYRDLIDNSKEIVKNENIKVLLGEKKANEKIVIQEDKKTDYLDLHNVIDADSSQAEAIELAKMGKSFVLQGPPGTGKSQTITNIIAECLSEGKKILFVSEKMAALNVVYDKLKQSGLSEFCLELHSHKANKKDFIDELNRTLKLDKSIVSSRATGEIMARKKSQKQLDEYANELHKVRQVIKKSLYQLYDLVASCKNVETLGYVIKDAEKKNDSFILEASNLLEDYQNYTDTIGYNYYENPWFGYKPKATSYSLKNQVKEDFISFKQLLEKLIVINDELKKELKLHCFNIQDFILYKDFFEVVRDSNFITPKMLDKENIDIVHENTLKLYELSKLILEDKKYIDSLYDTDIYKLDPNILNEKLFLFNSFGKRVFNFEYKKLIKQIRNCSLSDHKVRYNHALKLSEKLKNYNLNNINYLEIEKNIKDIYGKEYNGVLSSWELIINEINIVKELLSKNIKIDKFVNMSNDEFYNFKENFEKHYLKLDSLIKKNLELIERVEKYFYKTEYNTTKKGIKDVCQKINNCIENIDDIDNWSRFSLLLDKLQKIDCKRFVDFTIDKKVPVDKIVDMYKKIFYTQWIDYIIYNSEILSTFNRVSQDKAVSTFSEKDYLNFEINKAKIKAELSENRPNLDMISGGSAISILLREVEKKRKQKSIRYLLSEIGELIQILKPCFLMSPLSVSTFLTSDKIKFDLVIFDEASQIFPQDAIGTIYRGKQLIVVGDSKQMPPSNFFNSSLEGEEDLDDISDFESILDLCSVSFPQLRLKWHYRSRYEQLISFSNKNFYDNDLVTFPSAKTDRKGIGVDYYYVDGSFNHQTRTNRKEAEFIVDLIFKNIEKYPDRSLGVVAFSISQQSLIERLLNKQRKKDQSKEKFFNGNEKEPFFIKNLETVQGDERDTIIFSVAYGKDEYGKLLHNFGPINRKGGERRLNVAVTRAKHNVQLVSSMHYYDIDLNRTNSAGAKLLRDYLDYAENGKLIFDDKNTDLFLEKEKSELVSEIYEFLKSNDYNVDMNVGSSSFKIDLALKLPNSSDYILAIECDGKEYYKSKNARDRDRLRQDVLEKMGWKFYRIWSTDWYKNNKVEKEKLLKVCEEAIKSPRVYKNNVDLNENFAEKLEVKHFEFDKYEYVDIEEISKETNDLQEIVKRVLIKESPLSEEFLLSRISFMYDRKTVTNVVRSGYNKQMINCEANGIIIRNGFLYLDGHDNLIKFRVPKENEENRDIKYISLEELANGLIELIKLNVTVDRNGLYKKVSELLGFSRMSENITNRLDDSLKLIEDKLVIEGNNISYK